MVDMVVNLFHYTPSEIPAGLFILLHSMIILTIIYQTFIYYVNQKQQQQQQKQQQQHQQQQHDVELGKPISTTNTSQARVWEYHGIRLLWIVAATAICLIIGLGLRIEMLKNATLTTYIIHQALLIISPNALAFVNYSLLGLIIRASEQAQPLLLTTQPFYLRSKYVAPMFLLSDVASFFVQSGAAPMLTNADPAVQQRGTNMMIGGLFIQLTFFTLFTFIAVYIHRNTKYIDTRPTSMKPLFVLLYFTIMCLYIRSIYRAIEFITGHAGPVASLEWLFYVVDMVPVTFAMAAYAYARPQQILHLAQSEVQIGSHMTVSPRSPVVIISNTNYGTH